MTSKFFILRRVSRNLLSHRVARSVLYRGDKSMVANNVTSSREEFVGGGEDILERRGVRSVKRFVMELVEL